MKHDDSIKKKDSVEQLKELKEIKSIMNKSSFDISKKAGLSFIIWGSVWLLGFMLTQFLYDKAWIAWIFLVAGGVLATILVEIFIYRKKGRTDFSGNVWKVILSIIGILFFDTLIIFSFDLTSHIEITMILIYSTAVVYFLLGVFKTDLLVSLMGLVSGISIFIADMFFPSLFYLFASIFFGGVFLVSGIGLVIQKEKRYE
jgi:hypothetical protein